MYTNWTHFQNMFFATFGTSLALIASYFQQISPDTELLTVHIEHYLHQEWQMYQANTRHVDDCHVITDDQ